MSRWSITCLCALVVALPPAAWGAPPAPACPPGAAASCGPATRDARGCCAVVADAPRWCAPGRVWRGTCCPAGQLADGRGGPCVAAAAACRRGDAARCLQAGDAASALGRPVDLDAAEAFFAAACAAHVTRGCVRRAEVRIDRAGGDDATARLLGESRPVFEAACQAGDALACSDLGTYLLHGIGQTADPAGAAALRQRACQAGEPDGCVDLADQRERGLGVPADSAAATTARLLACRDWHAEGCAQAALALQDGRGVDRDPVAATQLLRRACEAGHRRACRWFGAARFAGQGTAVDEAGALPWLAEGCARGVWDACADVGWMVAHGRGAPADPARARGTLAQACDHDSSVACTRLGELWRDGLGGPIDPGRAAQLFARACQAGHDDGCAAQRKIGEARALSLVQRVRDLNQAGRLADMPVVVDELLGLQEQRFGPQHTIVLELLWESGKLEAHLERWERATERFSSLAGRLRQVAEPRPVPLAAVLERLVEALLERSSTASAVDDKQHAAERWVSEAEQVVAASQPALPGDLRARVALRRAQLAAGREDLPRALVALEAALKIPGVTAELELTLRVQQIEALLEAGRVLDAARAAQAMQARIEGLGRPRDWWIKVHLVNHRVLRLQADDDGADAALAVAERAARATDPKSGALAAVLRLRADRLENARNDAVAALALREEVVALEVARLGTPLHPDMQATLDAAAMTAAAAGRKVQTRRYLGQVEDLLAAQHPTPPGARAAFLLAKSVALGRIGDGAGSALASEEALAGAEKAWGPDSDPVAAVLKKRFIEAGGEPDKQLAIAERVLRIAAKLSPADRAAYADFTAQRLVLLARVGRLDEACPATSTVTEGAALEVRIACARRAGQADIALELMRRAMAEDIATGQFALSADSFDDLAWLLRQPGQRAATVELLRRGLSYDDEQLQRTIATGEAFRTNNADVMLHLTLWQAVDLLRLGPEIAAAVLPVVLEAAVRRKAVLSEASAQWQTLQHRGQADPSGRTTRLVQVRKQLAALSLGGGRALPEAEQRRLVTDLQGELETLQSQTQQVDRSRATAATAAMVAAAIPADAALVDLELALHVEASPPSQRVGFHMIALVLRRDRPPTWVDLGATGPLGDSVKDWRHALAGRRGDTGDIAEKLHAALLAPLLPHLKGVTELLVVPEAPVQLLPWAALRAPGGELLGKRMRVRYLDHARALIAPAHRDLPRTPPLVVAAPAFGPAGDGHAVRHFAPLPGTVAEGALLAALLPRARLLSGDHATEAALEGARGPSILHVATHGYFLADLPLEAALAGTRGVVLGRDLAGPATASPSPTTHPLLRSGLALAGANRPATASHDGLLSALEVVDLDLRGTQLVVLSACQTGIGDVAPGRGVAGLTSALREAGARSTLLSLWQVDDEATRAFMTLFYRNLLAGLARGEALRQAQLSIAAQPRWAHPFYWAAFVLNGDDGPVRLR